MICAINEENSDCRILEEISAFVINYIYSGLYDFYSWHKSLCLGYNKQAEKNIFAKVKTTFCLCENSTSLSNIIGNKNIKITTIVIK